MRTVKTLNRDHKVNRPIIIASTGETLAQEARRLRTQPVIDRPFV